MRVWLAVLFCGSLCLAQQPAPSAPSYRTVARLVTVDVVVTENNHPAKGLTREAFRILENGKEQAIKTFEEHSFSADSAAPITPAALPAHTYTNSLVAFGPPNVLLLDALNTPVKDQLYLRKEMVSYLKELPAGTRVAIFTLGTRLRMVQGFTTDVAALRAAMEGRRGKMEVSVLLDQPSDLATSMDNSINQTALDVLDQFQAEEATARSDLRVQTTLDAMRQLAAFLAGLPGRKNVIWLSGSFPLSLDPDESANNPFITMRSYSEQLKQISDAFTAERIAVYPVDVRGLLPNNMFDAANRYASPGVSASRHGRTGAPAAVARGDRQFFSQTSAEHATMQQLAEETGGRAFYETNALKQAVARAMYDGASYYTLTYTPQNKDFNGKFRKIEVKLGSGSYHLSYRRGYYARESAVHDVQVPDVLINPKHPALQHGAPPAVQVLFKARLLPADDPLLKDVHPRSGPAGLANLKLPVRRYFVDYSIDMHQINSDLGSDHLYHAGIELLAVAYDPDGKPVNMVDHAFQLSLKPEDYERLLHDGLPMHEEIDVPSGEIDLRLIVHDLMTDRAGSLEVPIRLNGLQGMQ